MPRRLPRSRAASRSSSSIWLASFPSHTDVPWRASPATLTPPGFGLEGFFFCPDVIRCPHANPSSGLRRRTAALCPRLSQYPGGQADAPGAGLLPMKVWTHPYEFQHGPVRCKSARHGLMLYLWRDKYIGRAIDLYGEYSEFEVRLLSQVVKPGMTVIEAGAN